MRGRLFLIGIDGADYHLVSRWMKAGLLPSLQRVKQSGAFGRSAHGGRRALCVPSRPIMR